MTHLVNDVLELDAGCVDLSRGVFSSATGAAVQLQGRETELLRYLATRPNQDISRDELNAQLWKLPPSSLSRVVDTTIVRLRKKLEGDSGHPRHLITLHGHGYRFTPKRAAAAHLQPTPAPAPRGFQLGHRYVDLARGCISSEGLEPLRLSLAEQRLLEVLEQAAPEMVDGAELVHRAWGSRVPRPVALRNAVHRLRQKLELDPASPQVLLSAPGRGYCLALPHTEDSLPNDVLWALAEHACRTLRLEDVVIYQMRRDQLVQVAAHGPKRAADRPLAIPLGSGIVGRAASTRQTQTITDTLIDSRYIADTFSGRSELAVPVVYRDRVVGVIDSEATAVNAYGERERHQLESLAGIAGPALAVTIRHAVRHDCDAPSKTVAIENGHHDRFQTRRGEP